MGNDVELNPGPYKYLVNMCHINIRSLVKNFDALEAYVDQSMDIITLSETLLHSNSNYNALKLDGYKALEYRNRTDQSGGGIGLYVKTHIIAIRKQEYEINSIEAMWHELHIGNTTIMLCTCYRPPNSGIEFWEHLNYSLELVKQNCSPGTILLAGDLNADPSSNHGKKLHQLALYNNMHIQVHEPTRITNMTKTILDQVLTSNPSLVHNVRIDPAIGNTDHCTVVISLKLKPKPDPAYKRLIWDYSKVDKAGLRRHIKEIDWSDCFAANDINTIVQNWTNTILNAARQFIPNKIITIRPKDKPWYNNELRHMKRKVLRLFKIAKKSNDDYKWQCYKTANNEYHDLIKDTKAKFEKSRFNSLVENPSKPKIWWRTVKQVLGYAQDTTVPSLRDGNRLIEDSASKAEKFNHFFTSHCNIDTSEANLPDDTRVSQTVIDNIVISCEEVEDLLKTLNTNKALGPDGISPQILKICAHELAPSLAKIFQLSLHIGEFPEQWKLANVLPLFKKGDPHMVENYRPVSLLSCISKVFERVIFKHVFNFLRDNLKITIHQSGFMPGDSTVNQLAYLYNFLAKALNDKKEVHIVFCDISKAFDRVWHAGLLYKFKKCGVEGKLLNWFGSYLQNRKQRVILNGQYSAWGNLMAGVPQGSVLGPLMFLVYINDIVDDITCNIKLFADDTAIFIDIDDMVTGQTVVNQDLTKLQAWSKQWLVDFNAKKTVAMNVSLKRNPCNPNLTFNSENVKFVESHKHLGLTLNNKLSWRNHIDSILIKANQRLDTMKRLKYKLDRKTLETIYFTHVRPILEYGSVVWDNCDDDSKSLIDKVQDDAARIVTGAIKGTSHDLLHQEVGWEDLSSRRNRQKVLLFYKMVHGQAPEYLCDMVPPQVKDINPHSSRFSEDLMGIKHRLVLFEKSFLPSVVDEWNKLPLGVRQIQNFKAFKNIVQVNKPKSKHIYYCGERNVNIQHARLRMQCSLLRGHLHKLHVIDSGLCLCQQSVETTEHYFMHCVFYAKQRKTLFENLRKLHIPNDEINVGLLLYGRNDLTLSSNKSIFGIVHKYFTETKRFIPN